MVTFVAVRPADPDGAPLWDPEFAARFALAMRGVLGYDRRTLSVPLMPGAYLVVPAPLGAVENLLDADRLVAELRRIFPGRRFFVATESFDEVEFLAARDTQRTRSTSKVALVA